jgi:hypothetical protein
MKKTGVICLIVLLFGIVDLVNPQKQQDIRETVQVVNVVVPVRVYFKGKLVENLTKSDFKLYEGKKRQDIHGFMLKRKKLKVQELEVTTTQEKSYKPRHFTLVFNITHYNDYIKKGLAHIFDNILKESDQLLVFVNDKSEAFKNLQDKFSAKKKLDDLLRDSSLEARNTLLLYLKQIEKEVDRHNFEMSIGSTGAVTNIHRLINEYFTRYLRIWRDYKKRYLAQDINKYYNFSQFLKNIKEEKWVINFYQFELFPDIILKSRSMRRIRDLIGGYQTSDNPELLSFSRILSRQIIEIEQELNMAKGFPADEVAKIFHNVDATFHSIFMKTSVSTLLEDVEYNQIATQLETSLRAITDRTGGELVVSNKLDIALDTISEKEDIYYVLTYAPKSPDKIGKIKIKTNNKKHKLVYSPNLRGGPLGQYLEGKEVKGTPVKIKLFNFVNGKLVLHISNFYWNKKDKGQLSIRIKITNEKGVAVLDQKKAITATKNEIRISLNLPALEKGRYNFVAEVQDLVTKKVASEFFEKGVIPIP